MGKRKNSAYFQRERAVFIPLFMILALIFLKLIWLQVFQASSLQAKGLETRTVEQSLLPQRGKIYDAQGRVLAQSMPVKEVYADPKTLTQLISQGQYTKMSKIEIANELGKILELDAKDILAKLNTNQMWISLAHHVDLTKAQEIRELKIPGVGFNDEEQRVYPMDTLAASTLGIVNQAGHGVEGLEAFYDKELFGQPAFASEGLGDSLMDNVLDQPVEPSPGEDITLTLDSTIQYLLEQQLDSLMQTTKAKSVTILAMDPVSGRILGMGNRPTFNPNNYASTNAEDRRNRAVNMTYEPGSTFKIVTGAAALEEGAVTPDEKFSDPGYLRVGPQLITNWDSDQKPHGNPTFTQGMELSSNVVLGQVGLKLGKTAFYTYLKAFGFGAKTGVDIAGEDGGLLVPIDKARDIELATMAFGQANLVTPIQLLTAICAVANGGTLYQPYIVDKITTPEGQVVRQNKPTPIRQVISKQTATEMTQILEKVVEEGTGASAAIPGIKVAGKTGTAQKLDPSTGQYSKTDFIASFAAYAPAENPKIALLIVIDTPQGESHQGGTLGGPIAKKILEGALQYYGVPVANTTPNSLTVTPDTAPVRPSPQAAVPQRQPLKGEVVVPDLKGMPIRQAGETLAKLNLHFNFTGSGLAYQQTPAPGTVITKGTRLEVEFSALGQSP